jgi:pyruvate kinase
MNKLQDFASTKIVCTIGPASQDVDTLVRMIEAGMDVARLNFSHGTYDQHRTTIENVREASRRTGAAVTLLQDLSGPKIRTGLLAEKQMVLTPGAEIVFMTDDVIGTGHRVSTTYKLLPNDVVEGSTILLDDGKIKLTVTRATQTEVFCRVVNGGVLGEKKGMNLPGVRVTAASLTEKDREDLKFGLANDVDYVALSFIRKAEDVKALRDILVREAPKGKRVPIVAKIEKPEAVEEFDAILREADVVMIARGDLGVELPPEDVPPVQKRIVRACNAAGIPVIVATQMLESMIEQPRPTRAEANDVANAVLDGADAVMLSGETSVGKFPVEAVLTMDRIIRRAESQRESMLLPPVQFQEPQDVYDSVARAACVVARQLGARAIVPITHSGTTAFRLSKYRPQAPIIAVTGREKILRRMNLAWGVRGIVVADYQRDADSAFKRILDELLRLGYVQRGDFVVFTAGLPLLQKSTTNTIKVEQVE